MTLEQRVKNLEKSVLQMQKNMTPLYAKTNNRDTIDNDFIH